MSYLYLYCMSNSAWHFWIPSKLIYTPFYRTKYMNRNYNKWLLLQPGLNSDQQTASLSSLGVPQMGSLGVPRMGQGSL
jgi:hypothetical protein